MKFTIDRSKWRCGDDSPTNQRGLGETLLMNKEGFQCCLGQIACQLGRKNILDIGTPEYIEDRVDDILTNYNVVEEYLVDTVLSSDAMAINDDDDINQKERERRLRELFKSEGHQLVFKNKAVKVK